MIRSDRAASMLEYALMVSIIIAAITGMRLYMQRGIQRVIKVAADDLGAPAQQYFRQTRNVVVDSQLWGAAEEGLIEYAAVGGGSMTNTTLSSNTILLEDSGSVSPAQETVIDEATRTTGVYFTTYVAGESNSFTAMQKKERPTTQTTSEIPEVVKVNDAKND